MDDFRSHPPKTLGGSKVVRIKDYLCSTDHDLVSGTTTVIGLPKSNVLQFFTENGSKVSVRPSGTEPKIKFYFGIKGHLKEKTDFDMVNAILEAQIEDIIRELKLG